MMKHFVGFTIVILSLLAAGCAQKRQIKVVFLSDPPGGTLYKQDGDVWGACPKTLWYDINSKAAQAGYIEAKGMIVRWPNGPESKSRSIIRLAVDRNEHELVFHQPQVDAVAPAGNPQANGADNLHTKGTEWQKARKAGNSEADQARPLLAAAPETPVATRPAENVSEAGEFRNGRVFTLQPKHLMLLDWDSLNGKPAGVKRKLSGSAVEFEIHFPSNSPGDCSKRFVSSGAGGNGDLIGADMSHYGKFALKLTLVSINGSSNPALKQKLVVGAVVGPTADRRPTTYAPATLSLAPSERAVTAITPVSADRVYEIGFHVQVENNQDWDAKGSTVVLRVEPARGGEVSPFDTR